MRRLGINLLSHHHYIRLSFTHSLSPSVALSLRSSSSVFEQQHQILGKLNMQVCKGEGRVSKDGDTKFIPQKTFSSLFIQGTSGSPEPSQGKCRFFHYCAT